MRARDQSSIFSTGGKFRPDYGLLLELHALTLVPPVLCALEGTNALRMLSALHYSQFLITYPHHDV